jgi:membrane dipeptidase
VSERRAPQFRFFDAHCDTFLKVVEEGADFETADNLHMTLTGMLQAGLCAQVFAAWTLAERLNGREDEVALQLVEAVIAMCRDHPDRFVLALTPADVEAACASSGRIAAICSLEGADPLKGDPHGLDRYYAAGVRLLTLAWADNPFCGSSYGTGSGLTATGYDLVAHCEELGVLVDVSHASDAAFWDVCSASTKPFVASHSSCRALCDNSRNLTDDMIRALANRGGVVGVTLYSGFLSPEFSAKDKEYRKTITSAPGAEQRTWDETGELMTAFHAGLQRPGLSVIADHVKHLIAVGGEDCVGLGGDLDGCDSLPQGIDSVADYPKIAGSLAAAGITPAQVEKVCYRNLERVFREAIG